MVCQFGPFFKFYKTTSYRSYPNRDMTVESISFLWKSGYEMLPVQVSKIGTPSSFQQVLNFVGSDGVMNFEDFRALIKDIASRRHLNRVKQMFFYFIFIFKCSLNVQNGKNPSNNIYI